MDGMGWVGMDGLDGIGWDAMDGWMDGWMDGMGGMRLME